MTPLPASITSEIDEMEFFQLHLGCDFDMPLDLLEYCRSIQIYWDRETSEGAIYDT